MRIYAALACLLVSLAAGAQHQKLEWNIGYVFSNPKSAMGKNIKDAHGFFMEMAFAPEKKRFALGAELSGNFYGQDKTRQSYTFSDGTTAPMDVTVSNSFLNALIGGRYYLKKSAVSPFISGKAGYSFYSTSLYMYDPNNTDHCEPVDSDLLKNDGTLVIAGGGGVRIDLRPKKNPGVVFLLLSASYTVGGKINYMNVDAPRSAQARSTDLYAPFINPQTQVIHEHYVGNVYNSPIRMLDYRVGISIKPFTCCRLCHTSR